MADSEGSEPTGRLFRSLRAEGDAAEAAVPALTLDQAVGLRTVSLGDPIGEPTSGGAAAVAVLAPAPPTVEPSPAEDVFVDDDPVVVAPAHDATAEAADAAATGRRGAHAAPGIRASGVWAVVIGVTVVFAFADALAVGRTSLGWLTGLALLCASIYGAIMVRRDDYIIAVIAPPIAFFIATITAGQLTLPAGGDLLVSEALMIVTTLGTNAAWIFGSTLVALAIVLFRRARAKSAT